MGAVEQSYATVEGYLSELDKTYDSFTVNQTTLAVSETRYEREREKATDGFVELYAKVENDNAEVLYTTEDDEPTLPSTSTADSEFESAVSTVVTEETGVHCRIVGIEEATIIGVRPEGAAEAETIYRLAVLFEARPTNGTETSTATWLHTEERESPVYV